MTMRPILIQVGTGNMTFTLFWADGPKQISLGSWKVRLLTIEKLFPDNNNLA